LSRTAASKSPLWTLYAKHTFGLDGLQGCYGPSGEDCKGNWARAVGLWHLAGTKVDMTPDAAKQPFNARWMSAWSRLRTWLSAHAPEVLETLNPGHSAASSDIKCPGLLGLWQYFDGQNAPMVPQVASATGSPVLGDGWNQGLFGGYAVYDHEVSMSLLSFEVGLRTTEFLHNHVPPLKEKHPTKRVFACTYNLNKIMLVDTRDGAVYVFRSGGGGDLVEPAAPAQSGLGEGDEVCLKGLEARPDLNGQRGFLGEFDSSKERWQVKMSDGTDHLVKPSNVDATSAEALMWGSAEVPGLLRWFEEYVRRLECGIYANIPHRPEDVTSKGICLMPMAGPQVTSCVTKGVEITSSVTYMAEHRQGWTYSISFRLVGTAQERGFKTCQLKSRTWIIQEDGQQPEHVNGEGVIGFFPILEDGGWQLNRESDPNRQYEQSGRRNGHVPGPFRYQSCSGRSASMCGSFSGHLQFFPGTIRRPEGAPFDVTLAKFPLRVPGYIY